jgi:hypothetical protein
MGRMRRRLERLEERNGKRGGHDPRPGPRAVVDPEEDKRRWLESRRGMRDDVVLIEEIRAIRWALEYLHLSAAKLEYLSYEEAVEAVFELTRSRTPEAPRELIEREVALAIYRREAGTENMVCPPAWRESFVAGDEIRERFMGIPDEEHVDVMKGVKTLDSVREEHGISEELVKRAVGPDHDEIEKAVGHDQDEPKRRIVEYLSEPFYGETAYRVSLLLKPDKGVPRVAQE